MDTTTALVPICVTDLMRSVWVGPLMDAEGLSERTVYVCVHG